MSGVGHGHREFRNRLFGHRELVPGFRGLKAEGLRPEGLTAVAVTRHLELIMTAAYISVSGFPLCECIASGGRWRERIQRGRGGNASPVT